MSALQFSLECLDQTIAPAVVAAVDQTASVVHNPTSSAPSVILEVSTQVMRNVFQVNFDANDVQELIGSGNYQDIKYYQNMAAWPNTYVMNVAHGMCDHAQEGGFTVNTSFSSDNTGTAYAANRMFMKDDAIRHLANELFGSQFGVDLLNNETALVEDVATQGQNLYNQHIQYKMRYLDIASELPGMVVEVSADNYCTDSSIETRNYSGEVLPKDSAGNNLTGITANGVGYSPNSTTQIVSMTRNLLQQMFSTAAGRDRFLNVANGQTSPYGPNTNGRTGENYMGDGSKNRMPLPFVNNDTITFKVVHQAGTNNITSNALTNRDYYITLVCKDAAIANTVIPADHGTPSQSIIAA